MKVGLPALEEFNELYTSRNLVDKLKWIMIRGAMASVMKYKLLGIRGKV